MSLAIVAQIIINNKIKCRRNLIVRKIAMLHIAHFIYLRSIFDGFPCEITKCACRNALNCHVDTHAKHNRAAEHTKESQTNETIQNYKNWSILRSEGALSLWRRETATHEMANDARMWRSSLVQWRRKSISNEMHATCGMCDMRR